jgi:hypothetical protein
MIRSNPTGRTPRTVQKPVIVKVVPPGEEWLAKQRKTHILNPKTGTLLCMPQKNDTNGAPVHDRKGRGKTTTENIVRVEGSQVTCGRCQKILAINHALDPVTNVIGQFDDLAIPMDKTERLVALETMARRSSSRSR